MAQSIICLALTVPVLCFFAQGTVLPKISAESSHIPAPNSQSHMFFDDNMIRFDASPEAEPSVEPLVTKKIGSSRQRKSDNKIGIVIGCAVGVPVFLLVLHFIVSYVKPSCTFPLCCK